jgi:hypothetical protein
LAKRWLPNAPLDAETMGAALWLERHYWTSMSNAIADGIGKAFNG